MEWMGFFLVIFTILIILMINGCRVKRDRKPNLPPGPIPWPVIGNLPQLRPVQHEGFAELSKIYGPIVSVWVCSSLTIVVSSASLAKEVLREKDHLLADRPRTMRTAANTKNGSDLIWADYGSQYLKLRRVTLHELLSPRKVRESSLIREEEMTAMVKLIGKWCEGEGRDGRSLELRRYLNMASFNCITRMTLGKRFIDDEGVTDKEGLELKAIILELAECNSSINLMEWIPWLRGVAGLGFGRGRFQRCQDWKNRFSRTLLEEEYKAGGGGDGHFLGALVRLREEHDLSEDNVIELIWDMMSAGLDTAVAAVEWAMAHLLKSPLILAQAQNELDSVVGTNNNVVMTELDFPKLQYLRCIVEETLRLHPSTPLMLPHKANADTKIGGYDVPKGTIVAVNVWAIGRDPTVWRDPGVFQPERFLVKDADMTGHDLRLLPFGSGRRMCPGAQLGINLVMLMLGRLLHHFTWRVEEEDLDMSDGTGLVCQMRCPLQTVPTPR